MITRAIVTYFLVAATCQATADDRVAGVSRDSVTAFPLERFFGIRQWEFTITETNLSRVDLRLLLGEEELLHTWHTDIYTNPVDHLDVALDFLDDLHLNQWRFFSAIEGQSGWFNRVINVPEWASSRNIRPDSMSSKPGPRGDHRFQLMWMMYEDGKIKKSIPLYLQIILNGDPIPTNAVSTAWPPVADPALTVPPASLTPELVAEAFGYPAVLKMDEVTDWRNNSYPGIPLWSLAFSAETNTFADVNVVGFQKGTFLTPEMEKQMAQAIGKYGESMAKLIDDERQLIEAIADPVVRDRREHYLDEMKSEIARRAPIKILDGSWGSKVYVKIMGFGPGGAAYGFITTSPDGKQDIMIATFVSGEGTPCPADSEKTHEYYVNMGERPLDLLATAGNRIAAEMFGSNEGQTKGSTCTGQP